MMARKGGLVVTQGKSLKKLWSEAVRVDCTDIVAYTFIELNCRYSFHLLFSYGRFSS